MSPSSHHYCVFDTAFGVCGVAWSDAGLIRVQLPERDPTATEQRLLKLAAIRWDAAPPHHAAHSVKQLQSYFNGERIVFAGVALDERSVADFNRRIYSALRDIGYGQTTTYGALADRAGSPGAAQAVGTAMSRNPWPVIVPCHRVMAAAKALGGFSAYGGAATKQRLLRLEGVDLDHGQPMLPGL